MPLGFERLNERTQRPNALINFIRPLPGPSSKVAETILSRIAAICYPFMKSNTILVQALEEFPYNNEFVGRNFNAGEVIQLVLKDKHGHWLPQRMVEMVMVHELAHCKQMNHSKAFWKVRDAYAVDLKALWAKGYTGEGMWGRGRNLESGAVQLENVNVGDIPEHLCGGTYGRRSKKRRIGKGKEKKSQTYAEKKQRRISKKFGAGGQALGADDNVKGTLESNTTKKGKPRVAGSARGRELRAAAALARCETVNKDEHAIKKEESTSSSETDDEYEEIGEAEAATDVDGKKLIDERGRPLIKLCEDDDDEDEDARREINEIEWFQISKIQSPYQVIPSPAQPVRQADAMSRTRSLPAVAKGSSSEKIDCPDDTDEHNPSLSTHTGSPIHGNSCGVCSLVNERESITCVACSNVLHLELVPDRWKCTSAQCEGSQYVNSGDVGICGICGTRKLAT